MPQQKKFEPHLQSVDHLTEAVAVTNIEATTTVSTLNSETVSEDWWFLDSGASHHVSHDLGNLSVGSEYSGGKVHMENDTGLSISHVGHSKFRFTSSPHTFLLTNLYEFLKLPRIYLV